MAYLAPLVRGFVSFVNRLTNATEPELGARPLVRGLVSRLTGLTKPEQGVPPPATPGRTFSPHGHGTNRATTSPGWRVDRGGRLSCPVTIYHSMICTRTPYHATQVRRRVRRAQSGGAAAEGQRSVEQVERLELDLGGPEQFVTSTDGKLIELPCAFR